MNTLSSYTANHHVWKPAITHTESSGRGGQESPQNQYVCMYVCMYMQVQLPRLALQKPVILVTLFCTIQNTVEPLFN